MMHKDHDNNMPKFICWVDHVGLRAFIKLFFLNFRYHFSEIFFITIDPRVQRLNNRLGKYGLAWKNVFLFADGFSPNGEMAVSNKTYDEVAAFIKKAIDPSPVVSPMLEFVANRYNKKTIDFFIQQEIAFEIESSIKILNCLIVQKQKVQLESQTKHVVLFKNHYWVRYIKDYYKPYVAAVCTYPNMKEPIDKLYVFVKLIAEILLNALLLLFGKRIIPAQMNPSTKIAVLYAQGSNFEKRTDYFWYPDSGLKPEQVLMYFKYSSKPPSPEAVSYVEKNNIPWVNLLPIKIGHKKWTGGAAEFNRFPSSIYLKYLIETFRSSLAMIKCCIFNSRSEVWAYWKYLTLVLTTANFFEAFFRTYQVKGHFALHEGGRDMVAANLAIEAVGGVDFCTHWSSYDAISLTMGKAHDVCFAWGPFFTKHFFSKPYYSIKNYVYSGYIFDGFFNACEMKAKEHRTKLLNQGAEFIICIFDQNNPEDRPLWNREVEKFYRRLFELLLEDSTLGFILKPKKVSPKVKLPGLAGLIDKAEATKRCLILQGDRFPNEASQASDLTIGVAVSSTPTVESALAGVRCITFDLEKNREHPFYNGGYRKIVFDDLDDMCRAIAQFRRDPKSLPGFGDYSFVLPEIDPFRDRKASKRIGQYMFQVITSLNEGKGKEEAIKFANAFYRAQYGRDKIVEKVTS